MATGYWKGPTGNWNVTTNWAATNTGTGTIAAVPGAGEIAGANTTLTTQSPAIIYLAGDRVVSALVFAHIGGLTSQTNYFGGTSTVAAVNSITVDSITNTVSTANSSVFYFNTAKTETSRAITLVVPPTGLTITNNSTSTTSVRYVQVYNFFKLTGTGNLTISGATTGIGESIYYHFDAQSNSDFSGQIIINNRGTVNAGNNSLYPSGKPFGNATRITVNTGGYLAFYPSSSGFGKTYNTPPITLAGGSFYSDPLNTVNNAITVAENSTGLILRAALATNPITVPATSTLTFNGVTLSTISPDFVGNFAMTGDVSVSAAAGTVGGVACSALGRLTGTRTITVSSNTMYINVSNCFSLSTSLVGDIPALIVSGSGTVNCGGTNNRIGQLTLSASGGLTGSGVRLLSTAVNAPSGSPTLTGPHLKGGATTTFSLTSGVTLTATGLKDGPSEAPGVASVDFTGGGAITLSSNSYSGTTTVTAGNLSISGTSPTGAGGITVKSGSNLLLGASTRLIGNVLLEAGTTLNPSAGATRYTTSAASGVLTLNAPATFGYHTFETGCRVVANEGATLEAYAFRGDVRIELNRTTPIYLDADIENDPTVTPTLVTSLTVSGTGELQVNGYAVSSYAWTGPTRISNVTVSTDGYIFYTIKGGTLTLENATITGYYGTTLTDRQIVFAGSYATLSSQQLDFKIVGGSFSYETPNTDFTFTFGSGQGTSSTSSTISTPLLDNGTGKLTFVKRGTSLLKLENSTNTFSGGCQIFEGYIEPVGAKDATSGPLGTSLVLFKGGGLRSTASGTPDYSGKFTATDQAYRFKPSSTGELIFATAFSSTGTSSFTGEGTGAIRLYAAASYTGNTTLIGGTGVEGGGSLVVHYNDSLGRYGELPSTTVVDFQILTGFTNSDYIFAVNNVGKSQVIAGLKGTGTAGRVSVGSGSILIIDNATDHIFGGTLAGSTTGVLVKRGVGRQTFSTNTVSSSAFASWTLEQGSLSVSSSSAIRTNLVYVGANAVTFAFADSTTSELNISTTSFTFQTTPSLTSNITFGSNLASLITVSALNLNSQTVTLNVATPLSVGQTTGGSIVKTGVATLTFRSASSSVTNMTVSAGLVTGACTFGLLTFDTTSNASVEMTSNTTAGALSSTSGRGGRISVRATTSAGTLTLNSTSGTYSYYGLIRDDPTYNVATSLTKSGTYTQILYGNSTYTGSTTISNGTLQVGSGNPFIGTSSISISAGGTLSVGTSSRYLTCPVSGSGTISLGTSSLYLQQSSSTTFSGAVSGTGSASLVVQGPTAQLTLTGTNSFPILRVSEGTVVFTNSSLDASLPYQTTVVEGTGVLRIYTAKVHPGSLLIIGGMVSLGY